MCFPIGFSNSKAGEILTDPAEKAIMGQFSIILSSEAAMANATNPFFPLFHPRSVAVIGASGNPLKMGYQCLLSLKQGSFPGPIYPVHPQEKEIVGLAVFTDVRQIPDPVDLAMLVVPAAEIFPALEACQKKGVRGIVMITAGFREIDDPKGEQLQKELSAFANRHGMKIIGPNTFAMANVHAQLNAPFTPLFSRLKSGPISVISQSGGVSHLIAYQALAERVGLGKVIGLGNRCNVDFADLLPYLTADEETGIIVLFVEGQDDARVLLLRQKQKSAKPIVFCANSSRGFIEDEVAEIESRGIPVYPLPERAVRALKGLFEYGEIREKKRHGAKGMGQGAPSKKQRA